MLQLMPFSILCGVGCVFGYALLGAAWLVLKTEGGLRDWAYQRLPWLLAGVVAVLVAAFIVAIVMQLHMFDRWLTTPVLLLLQLGGLPAIIGLGQGICRQRDTISLPSAVFVVAVAFLTLAASFWPYMIPNTVTVEDASAPRSYSGGRPSDFSVVLVYTGAMLFGLPRQGGEAGIGI
jgi:cytochrome d ubiquinol oxidase subunit II